MSIILRYFIYAIFAAAFIGISQKAGVVAQTRSLYETKIPTGSSYVRVVNGSHDQATVTLGTFPTQTLGVTNNIVTNYYLIPGGNALTISVNGKVGRPIDIPPNHFLTIVYRVASNAPRLKIIVDDPGNDTGLRVGLRFYNLISNCFGAIAIKGGTAVFDSVPQDQERYRSVNSASATLLPRCQRTEGSAFELPVLKAQSQYSIFLVGPNSRPVAIGNVDQTIDH